MSKFLIVGLGNIGSEYEHTRHNIGFDVVSYLAEEAKVPFKSDRLADVAHLKIKGKPIVLVKPSTYMNLSGKAVNYWLQQEKVELENLLVIVDELALPVGKIRINPKGSDGGHNGLKSIQETINTSNYNRLRFGIGNEFSKGKQADFVLGKWTSEEQKIVEAQIKVAAEAVKSFAFVGLARTMNTFNSK